MTRIAYDNDLFDPEKADDWFLRSLLTQHNEEAACYAWFRAECTALAEDLYSELFSPHRGDGSVATIAEFIEKRRIEIPISKKWNHSIHTLNNERLKDALRAVCLNPDRIDISVEKRQSRFGGRHFFEVTFTVR